MRDYSLSELFNLTRAELFALPYDWELAAARAENIASGAWRDALTVGSVT